MKDFTNFGLSHVLNRIMARKSNQFVIAHYHHTVIRYMEDSSIDADPATHRKFYC